VGTWITAGADAGDSSDLITRTLAAEAEGMLRMSRRPSRTGRLPAHPTA
jgi:hypothetical protein